MAALEEEKITGLLSGWGLAARPCDNCCSAAALLYCRADAAFLCGACDSKIHRHVAGARHERVWMCEVCEQAPAAVTCKADAAALCTACDRDIHSANPLARRHERVPVVPFFDSPADAAVRSSAASTFLFPDPTSSSAAGDNAGDADADAWLIPNPDFLYNNNSDLFDFGHGSRSQEKIQHKESFENHGFAFTDSVVPSQSNGKLSSYDNVNRFFQNCFELDFSQPNKHNKQIISAFNFSAQPSFSSSDIGVVPDGNTNSSSEVSYTFTKSASNACTGDGVSSASAGASPVPGLDREARVLRYREKRKNRKFEKTIRYASRKAYAETRPRIKGRFAKRTETIDTSEIDPIYGLRSTRFAIDQGGYGVVPSF